MALRFPPQSKYIWLRLEPRYAFTLNEGPRRLNAARKRFRLVQAGHENGQFHGFGHVANLLNGTAI